MAKSRRCVLLRAVRPTREGAAHAATRRRPVRSILSDVDRDEIIRVLRETEGRVGGRDGAASRLGLKRTTFITGMKKLGIRLHDVSGNGETVTDKT